ncbi:MAG: STAS domain-containing protein [Spirochaetes bacterium]|nr:STAS domain-containing protein [Spirochaetota bacterium]
MVHLTVEKKNSICIFHIKGEFFIDSIHKVEKIWEEEISKNPKIIAIDCSELSFIDSSAIGTLVKFLNAAMSKNIRLVFYDLSDSIKQIFETARLYNFFTITSKENFEKEYL